MELNLSDEQADELRDLLDQVLGDLGYEISATDNARFRSGLRTRRTTIVEIRELLGAGGERAAEPKYRLESNTYTMSPIALEEELAHPGD